MKFNSANAVEAQLFVHQQQTVGHALDCSTTLSRCTFYS